MRPIVAEPSGKHLSIDGTAGSAARRRRAGTAGAGNRKPAFEDRTQPVEGHGFGEIGVHAGRKAPLLLAAHRVRGHSDYRYPLSRPETLFIAELLRQLVPV